MRPSELTVFKAGVPAASLKRTERGTTFSYLDSYLTSALPSISSTLPKSDLALEHMGGVLPAFFAGLLPEGSRLDSLARQAKTDTSDHFSLIQLVGSDLIGDVQVLEPDQLVTDRQNAVLVDDRSPGIRELQKLAEHELAGALPGMQGKISAKRLKARAQGKNETFILKFDQPNLPHLVANEAFFMKLAKQSGVRVAQSEVVFDTEGQLLRVKRFDRIANESGIERLAVEDGCQVLDIYPTQKYDVDYLPLGQKLLELSNGSRSMAHSYFQQVVFSYLIGNGDAHAKNFSVVQWQPGLWDLSPGYDLLCTLFYDDDSMALPLDSAEGKWSRAQLLALADKLTLPTRAAERVIDSLCGKLGPLPDAIISGALPFQRSLNYKVAEKLKKRNRALRSDI